jgi:hypothetical protein
MGMTPSKQSSTKRTIRAALYARISTLNHGQNPESVVYSGIQGVNFSDLS